MWCSRGCLGTPAISDACLCHVSIAGGSRRRGCAAGGVPVFFSGLLAGDVDLAERERARGGVASPADRERVTPAGAVVGQVDLEVHGRLASGLSDTGDA